MLFKFDHIKHEQLRRYSEHGLYVAFTLLFIPGVTYDLLVMLPAVIETGTILYYGHVAVAFFMLFNFLGNMYKGMFTNTTIRGVNLEGFNKEGWTFCSECDCLRPPRSWHCEVCKVCILYRDHHCRYLASCVGYYNRRYFMMYTLYTHLGLIASLVYNVLFVHKYICWNHGLLLIKIACPPLGIIFDYGADSFSVLLLEANVVAASLTGMLFYYHLNHILNGKLYPERRMCNKDWIHNKGWKLNLVEAFGSRWYLIWVSPFLESKLLGNGIELPVIESKSKSE